MKSKNKKQIIIALTGGIASGKTLAAATLEGLGARIIDADVLSKQVQTRKEVLDKLYSTFKDKAFTNHELDKEKLRKEVFSNTESLKKLNGIIHPLVEKEIKARLSKISCGSPVFLVIPLLFESGMQSIADSVWTVSCEENIRLKRLKARSGLDDGLARAIIKSQFTDEEREARSQVILKNNSSQEKFIELVTNEYNKLVWESITP